MAAAQGIVLAKNIAVVANTAQVEWSGGFCSLVINATTYPTNLFLQVLGSDGTTWINIAPATNTSAPTTISANSAYAYNCPQGQYRLGMSGGTVAALYAVMVSVTY